MECSTSKYVCTKCLPDFWLIDGCCTECYDGFYKNNNGNCVRCTDSNCKVCGEEGICSECKPSFYLKDVGGTITCSLCTETGYGKTISSTNIATCTACIDGCSQCILNILTNSWTCAECDNCKFVEFCSKTYCIECNDGITQTQIGNYCYESNDCTMNCIFCATSTTCETCEANFYLTASKQCLSCGTDCITCSDTIGSCTKCAVGKFILGGACVGTCVDTCVGTSEIKVYKSSGKRFINYFKTLINFKNSI
jgi:proprotein convertase subtilisin/kexin type 5